MCCKNVMIIIKKFHAWFSFETLLICVCLQLLSVCKSILSESLSTFLLDRMMKQPCHLAHHHQSLHRPQDLEVLVSQALPTPSVMRHVGYAHQLSLAHLIWIYFSISSLATESSVYADSCTTVHWKEIPLLISYLPTINIILSSFFLESFCCVLG